MHHISKTWSNSVQLVCSVAASDDGVLAARPAPRVSAIVERSRAAKSHPGAEA